MPSAYRANVVCRELHGYHSDCFKVLFAFVVGLVSLNRKVCAFGLQQNILPLSFNGTSSDSGSRNCFGQKIQVNFDTARASKVRDCRKLEYTNLHLIE